MSVNKANIGLHTMTLSDRNPLSVLFSARCIKILGPSEVSSQNSCQN